MPLNSQYYCISGQSLSDVVLNTYGSMDQYIKGLNDNGFEPNDLPNTGQLFKWDNTLVNDETTVTLINNNSVKYATLTGFGIPEQPKPYMSQYYEIQAASYTATIDGEHMITIPESQNAVPVSAKLEIKELKPNEYIFDPVAGTWSLTDPHRMVKGQTLFVLFKALATTY